MRKLGVKTIYNARIKDIKVPKNREGHFVLKFDYNTVIKAKKVIFATGGASYTETGSTGDGFRIAENTGHGVTPMYPGIVPLKTRESWVKGIAGNYPGRCACNHQTSWEENGISMRETFFSHTLGFQDP